jgi:hypothetical protein
MTFVMTTRRCFNQNIFWGLFLLPCADFDIHFFYINGNFSALHQPGSAEKNKITMQLN